MDGRAGLFAEPQARGTNTIKLVMGYEHQGPPTRMITERKRKESDCSLHTKKGMCNMQLNYLKTECLVKNLSKPLDRSKF